jgi:hypothetical protein
MQSMDGKSMWRLSLDGGFDRFDGLINFLEVIRLVFRTFTNETKSSSRVETAEDLPLRYVLVDNESPHSKPRKLGEIWQTSLAQTIFDPITYPPVSLVTFFLNLSAAISTRNGRAAAGHRPIHDTGWNPTPGSLAEFHRPPVAVMGR